ncbi:MAG: hypothetical protein JXA30_23205 [Deltaproteobacteria bacterium]|nr:hypothetical protein [Deltaproteobacteria bacterium]
MPLFIGCGEISKSSADRTDAGDLEAVSEREESGPGSESHDGAMNADDSDAAFEKDGSDRDATVEPDPEGSPCKTPVRKVSADQTLDFSSRTNLVACVVDPVDPYIGVSILDVVRVDLEGTPVCENLSSPCELYHSGEPCTHECESDSDCPAGKVCICDVGAGEDRQPTVYNTVYIASAGPHNFCVSAECTGAADCGGWACGMSEAINEWVNGKGICQGVSNGFYCRSSRDDCFSDLDCESNERCAYGSEDGRWVCKLPPSCD